MKGEKVKRGKAVSGVKCLEKSGRAKGRRRKGSGPETRDPGQDEQGGRREAIQNPITKIQRKRSNLAILIGA